MQASETTERDPTKLVAHPRFNSVAGLRRYVAATIQLTQNGTVDPDLAKVLFQGCKLLSDLLDLSKLEKRLQLLEMKAFPPAGQQEGRDQ